MMPDHKKWNDRYLEGNLPWETGHASTELQRAFAAERPNAGRAIDLGCGTGANAVWLAQQGFEVVGVDLSPAALDMARRRATDAGVTVDFVVADLSKPVDIGPPFDFFFDRGCYHVLRRDDLAAEYFQAVRKLTHPGTVGLLLAGNARSPTPGPPTVNEDELRGDWQNDFDIVWLREFHFDKNLTDEDFQPLGWSAWLRRQPAQVTSKA